MAAEGPSLIDLAEILPADRWDTLTPSMVGGVADLASSLTAVAAYGYFEGGRDRFGWLQDPMNRLGDRADLFDPAGGVHFGEVFWTIRLRKRRSGWQVRKALRWASEAEARLAAGMEWAGSVGLIVSVHGRRIVVGPSLNEIADPAAYLKLLRDR